MSDKELKLQNQNLSRLLTQAIDHRDKALEMVRQKEESIKSRNEAIKARDLYIRELEARLEYYEGKECAGPLSGKH